MTPRAAALGLAGALAAAPAGAAAESILLQSTTSTANSGLYEAILPVFQAATGIEVRVVAVGTGQALRNARNCDADVVLVHARAAEDAFVAEGYGEARADVMYNDFLLVGPAEDPAAVASARSAGEALAVIADAEAPFASRGDDSGTHRKELQLWAAAGVDPAPGSGDWYRETGSGMGATLNIAAGMGAYALTDRATWAAFGNRAGLAAAFEGDPALHNPYGVIAVGAARCPGVRAQAAAAFVDWITGPEGQAAIGAFAPGGERLFVPDAR
ncbi:MAG: substrate-binding domain-containing protein [Pseudomonadota bacterium]